MSFVNSVLSHSGLSETTLRNRITYLKSLKLDESNYVEVLSNVGKVRSSNVNTTLAHCFHVLSFLRNVPVHPDKATAVETLISGYAGLVDKFKKQQLEDRSNNTKKESFVDLEELQQRLKRAKPEFDINRVERMDVLNNYKSIESYVLLSLYINTPAIRNDYYDMKLASRIEDTVDTLNYMMVSKKTIYILLGRFKTRKSFGRVRLDVDPHTIECIRAMLRYRSKMGFTSPYLFNHISKDGLEPISTGIAMIMRIRLWTVKLLGVRQSINDFRHAWETYIQKQPRYLDMTLRERAREHAKLLHHSRVALEYNRVNGGVDDLEWHD